MKKILFILVFTIFSSNVYAKWNDNIGDILATSLGAAISIPVAIATINPWATFIAGTAGASITYTAWNYIYNKYIPKNWK